jgi:hypothetical protein
MDAALANLLAVGYAKSPTLRRLVDRLQQSDVIVHIAPRILHSRRVDGTLQFVTRAGGYRYVRITINLPATPKAVIALLGHELQHALEVAEETSVMDRATFEALYRRIGCECGRTAGSISYDTPPAREAGERVLAEMRVAATGWVARR